MNAVAAVLAREFPDREPRRVAPARRGNTKQTFLVEFVDDARAGVVVQLSADPEGLRVETALARAVREQTPVPVPAVLATGRLDGEGYAVVERAPGVDLHERFVGLSPSERAGVARSFGRWLAACHERFRFDGHGPVSLAGGRLVAERPSRAWFESYLRAGLDSLPEPLADVRPAVAAAIDPSEYGGSARLFPWDLRPGNALYADRVTAVLDWGEPLAATPGVSAAKTEHLVCDWYVDGSEALRGAFRDGYRERRPWPDPSRTERLVAVVRSAVDATGAVTRPGYPERTGRAAVRFHRERLAALLEPTRGV